MSGGRYALVVVTTRYEDPTFKELRPVGTDAFRLNDVLSDPDIGDYNVQTLADRTNWEINIAIDRFFSHKDPDDLLLFYISGHGVKSDDGQLYFAARNTSLDLVAGTGVSSRYVRERIAASRPRRILALIDCCFSGAFGDLAVKSAGGVGVGNLAEGTGCVVLTASDSIEYSFVSGALTDQQPQASVFTDAVVHGLRTGEADRNRDGAVDVDELFDYVFPVVRRASHGKQTPTKYTLGGVHGSLKIAKSPLKLPPPPPPAPPQQQQQPALPPPPRQQPVPVPPPPLPLPPLRPTPPPASPRPTPTPTSTAPRRSLGPLVSKPWAPLLAAVLLAVAVTVALSTANRPRPSATSTSMPSPTPTTAHPTGTPHPTAARTPPVTMGPTVTPVPTVTAFAAWQPAPSFPVPVEAAGAAVYRNRVWLLGGHSHNTKAISTVQVFDPARMTWKIGPELPKALHDVGAVSDGHDLYAIGGETADDMVVDTVYRLKPDSSGWLLDSRSLLQPRASGGVVWDGSRILYAGGIDAGERDVADVFALGRSGWQRLGALTVARNSVAAATDGRGTTWFMSGQTGWTSDIRTSGDVDVLSHGTIAPTRHVTSRRAAAAVYLPGIGPCVLGGGAGSGFTPPVECPLNRSGVQPPDLRTRRAGLSAVVNKSRIWTFGGFYSGHTNSTLVEWIPFSTS
jgi:Caspase domain/Kelch motif